MRSDTSIEITEAREAVDLMYALAERPPPIILVLDSNMGCQLAANLLDHLEGTDWRLWGSGPTDGPDLFDQLIGASSKPDIYRAAVCAMLRSLKLDSANPKLALEKSHGQPWETALKRLMETLDETIDAIEHREAHSTLWAFGPILEQALHSPFTLRPFSNIDIASMTPWCACVQMLINAGVWNCITYEPVAILCRRPQSVQRDASGRRHSEDGPAVVWPDGHATSYFHGIPVPENITLDKIYNERNVELRRHLISRFGVGYYLHVSGAEEVDRDKDGAGMERILYHLRQWDDEDMVCVHVRCPSTGHEYMLRVPPDITTCAEAVAWTFSTTAAHYHPVQEG